MKAGRWLCFFCIIIGSGFFFTGIRSVEADQFKADMVQYIGEKSKASKIYVKDSKYRMEEKENGQQIIIIVDLDMGVTRVLNPMEKKYKEMKSTDMGSLMNDPILAARFMATKYAQKSLGIESINGFACDKSSFYHEDQLLMTQWVSKKLMFHLKIVTLGSGGRTMELKNIQEGPVDDALFQVPVGFAKKEDPREKTEKERAALAVVTTTVKGEMPWARRIGIGGEIRVKVDPQKSVRFKVKNLIAGESVFTIKAFRNGGPIKMDIKETYSLRGSVEPLLGLQNKAEEVAVRVEKGKVIAEVMAEDSPFAKDKAKSFFIMTDVQDHQQGMFIDSKRPLRLSITSDSQDGPQSKVQVNFYKGSYKDKVDDAEVVLRNGQNKTWEYPAKKGIKTLVIVVAKKGGVKVRIEQPIARKPSSAKVRLDRPASNGPFLLTKETKRQIGMAIQKNDIAGIKAFLDQGLDVNAKLSRDGSNVLMKASNIGTPQMVEMLIQRGADVKCVNKYGITALLRGLDNYEHWKLIAPLLINAGADVNARIKRDGYTPLWKAVGKTPKKGSREDAVRIIKLLLTKGADVNAPMTSKNVKFDGYTLLMNVAAKGYTQIVKLFLDSGADVHAKTKAGKTALDYAREKGHPEVVILLSI
jgi:ankyrin repeat protein